MPENAPESRVVYAPCRRLWATLLATGSFTTSATGLATVPTDAPSGINAAHTSLVAHWVKELPQSAKPRRESLVLRCYETIQHSNVIGVAHGLVIHAPVARLVSILDDYTHYKDLFEDTLDVRSRSVSNGVQVSWVQKAPVFFVSNTKFTLNTVVRDELPQRKIWHSRLVSSNQLLGSDSFVAVYPLGPAQSYYWEVDFIDAKWGMLATFAMSRIWTGAVTAIAVADLDVKYRAENSAWTYAQVREIARKRLDVPLVDQCVKHRVALDLRKEPSLNEP